MMPSRSTLLLCAPSQRGQPASSLRGVCLLLGVVLGVASLGCAGGSSGIRPTGGAADSGAIDLARFMGDWYVLAHIPTRPEQNAWEALEQYRLREDGDVDVTFAFCEGGFDGELEVITMRGRVHDETTNAEWRVRPFWPLSLAYQVLELDADYQRTVIGHPSGRYAWIMARRPDGLAEDEIAAITTRLAEQGYEVDRMRRVPHRDGACRSVEPD